MSEIDKWMEASSAWSEVKRNLLSESDFWAIVHDLVLA